MTPAGLLLRRTLGPLLVLAVGAGALAAGIATRSRPGVEVSLAFTVPVPVGARAGEGAARGTGEPPEPFRAAEAFTDTLAGWLTSPDLVANVYRRAGMNFPRKSVRRLSRAFTARKLGGQVVDVRFSAPSEAEAAALARAVVAEVDERTVVVNAGGHSLVLRAIPGQPLIVPVPFSPLLRGLVAAVVALVLGVNAVLLWDFLRSPPGLPSPV